MSYDISLLDPITKKIIEFDYPHQMRGGTCVLGGTTEAWLNVTYNYSKHYRKHLDQGKGIRIIYGKTGAQSIPMLQRAIDKLGDNVNDDYWKSTEGNAKRALMQLRAMAEMRPDGIWDGD